VCVVFKQNNSLMKRKFALNNSVSEKKENNNPREGWEDGTPPPHRDFKGEVCGALAVVSISRRGRRLNFFLVAEQISQMLAARTGAAAPSPPVGPRRLAVAVLNNGIGADSSRRAAGDASSAKF